MQFVRTVLTGRQRVRRQSCSGYREHPFFSCKLAVTATDFWQIVYGNFVFRSILCLLRACKIRARSSDLIFGVICSIAYLESDFTVLHCLPGDCSHARVWQGSR
jgi:hypothetical protein